MAKHQESQGIPLPRGWPRRVRSAMLHVIALAQYAVTYTRSWAVNGRIARLRIKAENDQLRQEEALLREEIRIKAAHEACRATETTALCANRAHGDPRTPCRTGMDRATGSRDFSRHTSDGRILDETR